MHRSLAVLLALLAVPLFPPFVAAADSPSPGHTDISGSLSLRYVYRTAEHPGGRVSDQDVYSDLRMDATRPSRGDYELHLLGSVRSDLDGDQNVGPYFPLEDINNTHKGRTTADLYEAYMVWNSTTRSATRVRVGRQAGTRDEVVYFDGLSMDIGVAEGKANLTLYGGAAVSFNEVGGHWGDDVVDGVGVDYQPLPSLGMSADYLLLVDRPGELPATGEQLDRMAALKVWYRFEPFTRLSAAYRYLDGDPRDLSLKAASVVPGADLELTAALYRQIQHADELATETAPFTTVLGVSAPFQSVDLKARKFLGDWAVVDVGYYARRLVDPDDSGPFNKEYIRSYGTMELTDLFAPGLSLAATGEQWRTSGAKTVSGGADAAYRFKARGRNTRLGVGSFYSLYKYDSYVHLGLRENVRTYYVEGKHEVARSLSVNGRYELEHGIERYQTMRLGMRYDF